MNSPLSRLHAGFLAVILACFFSPAFLHAADAPPPGVLAFTIEVPGDKLSSEDVTNLVHKAAKGRGWIIKDSSSAQTTTYLNHRKNEATVTYLVTAKQIVAYCEGYATDGNGKRKGPEQPRGWLKFLKEDLLKGLNDAVYLDKK